MLRYVLIIGFYFGTRLNDFQIVRWISSLVARRAALLSGVAVATVLIQTENASLLDKTKPAKGTSEKLGVGVDGR